MSTTRSVLYTEASWPCSSQKRCVTDSLPVRRWSTPYVACKDPSSLIPLVRDQGRRLSGSPSERSGVDDALNASSRTTAATLPFRPRGRTVASSQIRGGENPDAQRRHHHHASGRRTGPLAIADGFSLNRRIVGTAPRACSGRSPVALLGDERAGWCRDDA